LRISFDDNLRFSHLKSKDDEFTTFFSSHVRFDLSSSSFPRAKELPMIF